MHGRNSYRILQNISRIKLSRATQNEDYHLARHNRWTDIQLSDTFSHNREETGGKKGSQSESVDRQLTDVIRPSSRLGGLEKVGRGYTLSWSLSIETGLSSGYRNLMPPERGTSKLLSSIYSRKRLWQETSVAELSILSLADFARERMRLHSGSETTYAIPRRSVREKLFIFQCFKYDVFPNYSWILKIISELKNYSSDIKFTRSVTLF